MRLKVSAVYTTALLSSMAVMGLVPAHATEIRSADGALGLRMADFNASKPADVNFQDEDADQQVEGETTTDSASGRGASSPSSSEQIVVTASRRGAQSTQSIPMAVTAVSGEQLEDLKVETIKDLNKIDASLAILDQGATKQTVVIRGVASDIGRTVGMFLDEAPLVGGFNGNVAGDGGPSIRLHDIERVEVLNGPQGTLFGAGSMAGTLRFITNKPDLNIIEGKVAGSAALVDHGNELYDANAMINIPVVDDRVGLRFVGWVEEGGGYIEKVINGVTTKNVNDRSIQGFRAQARVEPTESLSLLFSYNYQDAEVDGSQRWTEFLGPIDAPGGTITGPFPVFENHAPSQEPWFADYELITATADLDVGFGTITATGTRSNQSSVEANDSSPTLCSFGLCEGSPAYPVNFTAALDYGVWTGEGKFSSDFGGPFELVAGVYYERDDLFYSGQAVIADPATGELPCLTYMSCVDAGLQEAGSLSVFFSNNDKLITTQWAFYGQGEYQIVPTLTLTAGIRYYTAKLDDNKMAQQDIGDWFGGVATTPYTTDADSSKESKTTFNIALLWEATPDISLFARAASGFRVGGVNQAATIAEQLGVTVASGFGPDTLWNYEAGVKAYVLDRRVRFDLVAYHIDWTDQQQGALAGGSFNYTLNVGSTKIDGFQLTTDINPVEGLDITGSVTYVDARLAEDLPPEVVAAGTIGLKGDSLPNVPKFRASGNISYERPVTDNAAVYVQAGAQFRDKTHLEYRFDPSNFYLELPSYILVDASAGVKFNDGRYNLGVFAGNLTNKAALVSSGKFLDGTRHYIAMPRTLGVRFSGEF